MTALQKTEKLGKSTFGGALNAGLRAALANDPKVLLMGEDIGKLGGVFRITDGLQAEFGEHRVLDSPLAESGIIGTAVGLAYRGYRPVPEIQFDGFVYPAFDQIVSQVAKIHYRTGGAVTIPMTIRIPFGGGIGSPEHHSESPEAYFVHTPGLRVVSPSSPAEAYWMIQDAIACEDPVIFFEPKRHYHDKQDLTGIEEGKDRLPLGAARVAREGEHVTLVSYGSLVKTCLNVATAAEDEGISIEVIDLRSLSPIDFGTIEASVRKTGRLVIAHEAALTGGLGAEIATGVTERCFHYLEHAPVRVTGWDLPYPPSKLEKHHVPDLDRILDGVDRALDRPNSYSRFEGK
ncbi:alpha-ketoacid dehydrogenase subunit beta [Neomicrococcus lactis]